MIYEKQVIQEDCQPQQSKDEKSLKLPKIQRNLSRGLKKQQRSINRLPTLKNQSHVDITESSTDRATILENDFLGQVEKQIRFVMKQQDIKQTLEGEENEDDTFFNKIKQNKEIIKRARKNSEQFGNPQDLIAQFMKHKHLSLKKVGQKNCSQLVQKRSRQNNQPTQENNKKGHIVFTQKQNQKSPQALRQARNLNGALREFISNRQLHSREAKNMEVKSNVQIPHINKISPQSNKKIEQKVEIQKIPKQKSSNNFSSLEKHQCLFDAIQNYLQNPKKPALEPIDLNKIEIEKASLQQRLKRYQQKIQVNMGQIKPQDQKSLNKPAIYTDQLNIVTNDWHKMGIGRGNISKEASSFDHQVERINFYIQKNERSLQKYVQNQKLLLDVQLGSNKKPIKPINKLI